VADASGVQGSTISVTLMGANFLTGAPVSTSNSGISVGNPTVSATQITVPFTIATNAATGPANVTVTTVNGTSAPATFTVNPPRPVITNLFPASAAAGSVVVINGTNFGSPQGSSTVSFNGILAATASNWSATGITVIVPAGATTGSVVVTVGGQTSLGASFTVIAPPTITSIFPTSAPVGASVTITGVGFGSTQGNSTVSFGGVLTATIPYWSDSSITVIVPNGAATGAVTVTVNAATGTGPTYTLTNPPVLTSVSPQEARPGDSVTFTGTGFGSQQGIGQVWLGTMVEQEIYEDNHIDRGVARLRLPWWRSRRPFRSHWNRA
jgi:hypothetical protein